MKTGTNQIYAPNSVYHGMRLHGNRLPFSTETLMRIELERLRDFVEFLFEHSEHCDHISQKDAWKEFNIFEAKHSYHREYIKEKRATVLNSLENNKII